MNSPSDQPFVAGLPGEPDAAQAQIEDYLDYLCAPLLGLVPYDARRRLRLETEDHLRTLAEDFKAEGFAPDEAVAVALTEYGEPWRLGQDFADAWLPGPLACRPARFTDAAAFRAFGCFGVFSVLCLLGAEQCALLPHQEPLGFALQCLAVLAPLFAGVLTGLAGHAKTPYGICRAVLVLSLASAVIGLLLWPHPEVLQLALFLLVFWLPTGCLAAAVTVSLRRQFHRQHFHPMTPRS